ncbi:peptidase s15 [Nannochloropsis gaditana]|nr:peptidase s15 [Nannochloropsis gaditana]
MDYDFTDSHCLRQQLLFTSSPLSADLEVTGFPLATLLVSSSQPDAALFLFLLCVDTQGKAHYITEACLRVSSRATLPPSTPPSPSSSLGTSVLCYPGLPRHSFRRADVKFLTPGVPVRVEIVFQPSSYRILRGQSIRLAVAGSNPRDFLPIPLGEGVDFYDLTLHVDAGKDERAGIERRMEGSNAGLGGCRLVLPVV